MTMKRPAWHARLATMLLAASTLLPLVAAMPAAAQQLPPVVRIYGAITIAAANAPAGATVTAYAGTTLCSLPNTGAYNGTQYYVDIDSSQVVCAVSGTTLTFQV